VLGDLVLVGVCTMDHTNGSRHSPWFESLGADEVQTGALKVFNYSAWWAGTQHVPAFTIAEQSALGQDDTGCSCNMLVYHIYVRELDE
jgi:hypothetical protein